MLQHLYIRNYAIIEELHITFDQHLNVLTGETGAGKSIILGALSLMLGERADTSVLINPDEKCIVEATFLTADNEPLGVLMEAAELDVEDTTVIRREINASGKSRAFINDTPVNLSTLSQVTGLLVDLHRQSDQYALKDTQFMYEVIDAVSGNAALLKNYREAYHHFKKLQAAHVQACSRREAWQREADYKKFLYEELADANWQPDEIEQAEVTLKQLNHAEQIKQALQGVAYTLEEGDMAVNTMLKQLQQQLQHIGNVHPESAALADRLESAWLELRDIAAESSILESRVELAPGQLQSLQERLDLGYRLWKKHQVQTTSALILLTAELKMQLEQQQHSDEQIKKLEEALAVAETEMSRLADILHDKRAAEGPRLAASVNRLLALVGMPNALLKIETEEKEDYDTYGKDRVSFLWDANKSGKFQPVQKSASGGELSRIMLCIKTLTAEALALPTLIFDEVDAGISGEAARQVSILLRTLGERHQIICITHQPQVAGKGSAHFYVYKTTEKDRVQTRIRSLDKEERIHTIAQMIGGEKPSEAAIKSARELIG